MEDKLSDSHLDNTNISSNYGRLVPRSVRMPKYEDVHIFFL